MSTFVKRTDIALLGAHTLPGRYFNSPEIFAEETEKIFLQRWLCVGRESRIARPGQYFLQSTGGESVIVLRDRQGAVRAYYNVCRHRGTRLCEEHEGQFAGTIQCPYHAWTYTLDVRRVFRGSLGKRVEVSTENNSGRYPLEVGHEYLLFAKAECRPLVIFGGCGHSAPTRQAGSTLRALEGLVQSKRGASSSEPANPRLQQPAAASGSGRR